MERQLSLKTIVGYGAASVADSGTYNFVLAYFMFFLTNVSMVSPERAGLISLIAICGSGFFTVLVGYGSDRTNSRWGRRLPYLLIAMLPLAVSLYCMFSPVAFGEVGTFLYYGGFSLLFWGAFALYYIPYSAMGAELTSDYHQRTRLRNWARVFGVTGNLVGTALPLALVGYLVAEVALPESQAWQYAALFVGLAAAVSIMTTIAATWRKQGQETLRSFPKSNLLDIVREYRQLLTLRPYHYLLAAIAFFTLGSTFFSADLLYYMKYNLRLGEALVSTLYLVMSLFSIALTPVASLVAARLGKSKGLGVLMLVSGALMLGSWLVGIDSFFRVLVHMILFAIGYSAFWQIINSIAYDISEVDEFVFGRRREGSIISLNTVMVMLMPAIAMQLLGLILDLSGYAPAAQGQTASALLGIELAFTLLPALLFVATALALFLYPLSRQRFELLKQAIRVKEQGETADLAGLERIVR